MSSLVALVPTLLQTSATLQDGRDARANARLLREHSRAELSAAARDEEAQRRSSRLQIGRQAAAAAEAGGGLGGSAGDLLEQSAVFAELDALNIRYGGQLRSKGSLSQSIGLQRRARSSGLLAGAQLLAGGSRAFTNARLSGG